MDETASKQMPTTGLPASCSLVIIGATPSALHLLSRLPESILRGAVVIDRRGSWLAAWEAWCSRLELDVVRCTVSQCPAREPGALQAYASKAGRLGDIVASSKRFTPCPHWTLLRDFCMDEIVGRLPGHVIRVIKAVVIAIERASAENARCRVTLEGGACVTAAHVVSCLSLLVPVKPRWMSELPSDLRDGIQIARDVDLRVRNLSGVSVLVIGGGMTGALLATGAARHGAKDVTLVCRRPLKRQEFDASPGWCGNKCLRSFLAASPLRRLNSCRAARPQSSINQHCWRQVKRLAGDGVIRVLDGHVVDSLQRADSRWCVKATNLTNNQDAELLCDLLWVCCGHYVDVKSHPLLGKLQSSMPTRVVGGYPVLDDETLCWPGVPFHVTGRGAMLSVGPLAGTPAGHRLAALQIQRAVSGKGTACSKDVTAPWERVLKQIQSSEGLGEGDADAPLDHEVAFEHSKKAPLPAARIENVPSEFIERFGSAISKRAIRNYKWLDDNFHVKIVLPVEGPLEDGGLGVFFSDRSVQAWAVTKAGIGFHFHVPKLFRRVLVERCTYKWDAARNAVNIKLQKTSDAEWRFLKG